MGIGEFIPGTSARRMKEALEQDKIKSTRPFLDYVREGKKTEGSNEGSNRDKLDSWLKPFDYRLRDILQELTDLDLTREKASDLEKEFNSVVSEVGINEDAEDVIFLVFPTKITACITRWGDTENRIAINVVHPDDIREKIQIISRKK